MILYHGTDTYFKEFRMPEIDSKDFGAGVYLAVNKEHAMRVAYWKALHSGSSYRFLYTYNINLDSVRKRYKVKIFRGASVEWIKYVMKNRSCGSGLDYDMIIGPTADASAQRIINEVCKNEFRSIKIDYGAVRNRLKVGVYGNQVCIKSQRLLNEVNKLRIMETMI